MNSLELCESIRFNKKEYIKEKYNKIIEEKVEGYSLVSIVLKNFKDYKHEVGHNLEEEIITNCYKLLLDLLEDDEYISNVNTWYFNLLIKCPAEEEILHKWAQKFHEAIKYPMKEKYGKSLYIEMGFYPIIDTYIDFSTAQYYADLCRKGPHSFYKESNYDMYYVSYHDQNEKFKKLGKDLQEALDNGEFKLYLQPKVDIKTGKVHSAEALMRWVDPIKGIIPINDFLPNIEENGFIRNVDLYLFDKACSFIEKWIKEYNKEIKISFNLSRAYFNGQYFIPEYREVFRKYNIPSNCICIELLESVVLNELEKLKPIVEGIYNLGFECALDDFGSGFSSFDILTNINLAELKIDRSLFKNIDNHKERYLLKHLVEISHDLGMRVVAEGIETLDYVEYLKKINCDYIQGYFFYKPMPIEEFEKEFITKKNILDKDIGARII